MRCAPMIVWMTAVSCVLPGGSRALAQDTAAGRYTMTPSGDSMLRLDTRTGAVSDCRESSGSWICKSVADDRLALQDEIDRLTRENARLKARLSSRDGNTQQAPDAAPESPRSLLPSDEQVDEFMTFFETMMRRFKDMVEKMKQEPQSRL